MRKFIILVLTLSFHGLANAQSNQPLAININGQIYQWSIDESEPVPSGCDLQGYRLHNWDSSLLSSPDGLWVTFMALEEGAMPSAPADTGLLWVCNVLTGQAYQLSEINQTRMVSKGAFSPDSNQIIWTEVADAMSNDSVARLMLHDLLRNETRVLVDSLPLTIYCSVSSGAPQLIWGEKGIVIPYALPESSSDPCSPVAETGFAHYAADGSLLNRFPVQNSNLDIFVWLAGAENRLAYYGYRNERHETQLYSINLDTGEIREEDGVIEAFMPFEGSGAYHITDAEFGYCPLMIYPPANAAPLETQADVALSPEGQMMVVILGHSLYFLENGRMYPASWNMLSYEPYAFAASFADYNSFDYALSGQLEVAWATPQYRIVPRPESACPALEEQNIEFSAQVVEGLGDNNLRSAPYRESELLGTIAEGTFVNMFPNFSPYAELPTPVCSGGIRWKEVVFEGLIAWTAEAEGESYYLQEIQRP